MVPSLEMWKEEGVKGLIGFFGNVFFIVKRVGGYFFAQIDYGGRGQLKHTGLQQKGCTLIYIYIFLIVEGEGGWRYGVFFRVPSSEMWKEEGGKGLIGFSGNVFFIMEKVGGYFFYKLIMGGGSVETHRPAIDLTSKMRQRVHLDFFFFFFNC
jgi:hypothetical protein